MPDRVKNDNLGVVVGSDSILHHSGSDGTRKCYVVVQSHYCRLTCGFPALSPARYLDRLDVDVRYLYRYDYRMFTLPRILKTSVKVSPKFQIVIPKAIREEMKLEPGQELFMYLYEGKLHLDTLRPVTEIRGIAKGMKWRDDYRDRNDRF